jgi:hypothetical protein
VLAELRQLSVTGHSGKSIQQVRSLRAGTVLLCWIVIPIHQRWESIPASSLAVATSGLKIAVMSLSPSALPSLEFR